MSIPTSGTYTFTIIVLKTYSIQNGASSNPLAVYTVGSGSNTAYYSEKVTFDGTNLYFTDSDGNNKEITYNSSYIAGQGNYNYDSLILQSSTDSGTYYYLSQEPDSNLTSGKQITQYSNTPTYWKFEDRIFDTNASSEDAFPDTCFLSGTFISTPSGHTTVENLSVGDEITAYIDGTEISRHVTWTGQTRCNVRPHLPLDQAGYPVRILKDAISEGVPFKDLLVTAEHCLFFDGKFVPARMLVNGRSIFYDKSITSYDYYHIETEDHSVIMADGMLTESYLDTGNRRSFTQKGSVVSIGGSRNLSWDDAAAPLSVSREAVEPIFRKIEARSEQNSCPIQTKVQPLTHDRDLHLITNTGATIRQIRENNDHVMFMIPTGVESVRIVSNASRPCDVVGPFVDDRRALGVLVGDVRLFEGNRTTSLTAHLQEEKLSGWNNVADGTMRWTDGNALLNLGQRPSGSIALMALKIHAAGPYLLTKTASEQAALQA